MQYNPLLLPYAVFKSTIDDENSKLVKARSFLLQNYRTNLNLYEYLIINNLLLIDFIS